MIRPPWLLRLLYQPDVELDLVDPTGKPDHGKAIGFFVAVVLLALVAIGVIPGTLGVVIVLVSAAFGQRVFIAFLKSRTVTVAAQEQVTMTIKPLVRPFDNPDRE